MSEMFAAGAAGLTPPPRGTVAVAAAELSWQPSGSEGFWIKPLYQPGADGERTWLMRIDAGAFAPLHAHAETEQIYVLEGSFHDQHQTYRPGDFIVRAPGAEHTTGSRDGATVLLVYSRP